jgi:HPt (histidine-containing phosphotransfer) domain-containing protein
MRVGFLSSHGHFGLRSSQNSGETVAGHVQNLRPWPKGVSGNPGGRPKKKLITDEIERLLEQEAPDATGKTWATVIAQALLNQARMGDVRAIAELANRTEGKPLQQVALGVDADLETLAERLENARKRVLGDMSEEELNSRLKRLKAELGVPSTG